MLCWCGYRPSQPGPLCMGRQPTQRPIVASPWRGVRPPPGHHPVRGRDRTRATRRGSGPARATRSCWCGRLRTVLRPNPARAGLSASAGPHRLAPSQTADHGAGGRSGPSPGRRWGRRNCPVAFRLRPDGRRSVPSCWSHRGRVWTCWAPTPAASVIARVGHSQACPFDQHALVPVLDAILRRGPDGQDALDWLWTHWGTHADAAPCGRGRSGCGRDRDAAAWGAREGGCAH
jgi:hypothetical protein